MSRWLSLLAIPALLLAQARFPWDTDRPDAQGPVRTIRVERAELAADTGEPREGPPRPVEEAVYRPDGRLAQRYFFNDAGVIHRREIAHFDGTGRRIALITYDLRGTELFGRFFRPSAPGVEEEIVRKAAAPMDRFIRRFDPAGRLASVENFDLSGQMQYRLVTAWDTRGRLGSVLMFVTGLKEFDPSAAEANPASLLMRVDVGYTPDGQARVSVTGPGGEPMGKSTVEERFAAAAVDNALFQHRNPLEGGIVEKIEQTDTHGNWIRSRQVRASDGRAVTVTYRRIGYFQ